MPFTRFYKAGSEFIKLYYKKVIENAALLYKLIDPCLLSRVNCKDQPFWVSQKDDVATTYLEIGFKNKDLADSIYSELILTHSVHNRDSFGYRETSILMFESDKNIAIRIMAGLESDEEIRDYAKRISETLLVRCSCEFN